VRLKKIPAGHEFYFIKIKIYSEAEKVVPDTSFI